MSLNVPQLGNIQYKNQPGTTYGPTTEKATHLQKFIALANQHSNLVSINIVGQSSHSEQWDEVVFEIGNPHGGTILWDACTHGNEEMPTESMYAIMNWLLTPNSNPLYVFFSFSISFVYVCFFAISW